jgi:hypothetical protein
MRKVWVFLLATVAFAIGAFVAVAYSGAKGSLASLRIACELLNTAEGTGMLDRAQRADVVDRAIREMHKSSAQPDTQITDFVGQFKTGCPNVANWRG